MPPTIHLIRHGHGFHNVPPESLSRNIRDAALTPTGLAQAAAFARAHASTDLAALDLVCASPMTRALQTALAAFAPWLAQDPARAVLALPDALEVPADPSNHGSALPALRAALQPDAHRVDWTEVERHPYWYRRIGRFDGAPRPVVDDRARRFKQWLRDRPEAHVAVVGHGVFWHYVTGDMDADGQQTGPYWLHLMWRTFEFAADGSLDLVETEASRLRTAALIKEAGM